MSDLVNRPSGTRGFLAGSCSEAKLHGKLAHAIALAVKHSSAPAIQAGLRSDVVVRVSVGSHADPAVFQAVLEGFEVIGFSFGKMAVGVLLEV